LITALHVAGNIYDLSSPDKNAEAMMNFIESLFGIAPDGGDGSLEWLLLLLPLVGVAAVAAWRRRRRTAVRLRRRGR